MVLALFDFDGTITSKDSLAEFIKFAVGKKSYYFDLFRLSPILIKYTLKITTNDEAKETVLSYFFKGWDFDKFNRIADDYSTTQINKIIRPKALQRIKWHQQNGEIVAVVSASMESWLRKWCQNNRY